ncbi:MAG: VTT domain-containing protein [Planctomycetota bacterium]
MKPLLKIVLVLWLFFTSILILLKVTGLVTVEKIKLWIEMAEEADPTYAALAVAGLLFVDLFIAIPSTTVTLLGGYFLGPVYGAIAAFTGLLLAGTTGYGISRRYGDSLLNFLIRNEEKRAEAVELFRTHGAVVVLLSRAMPLLPEVSACMAGMTRMPFAKFLLAWVVSTAPYAMIASYAGSVSTVENPLPAILAVIGLTGFFWLGGFVIKKRNDGKQRDGDLQSEASRV